MMLEMPVFRLHYLAFRVQPSFSPANTQRIFLRFNHYGELEN
jgi:hypothetical protein